MPVVFTLLLQLITLEANFWCFWIYYILAKQYHLSLCVYERQELILLCVTILNSNFQRLMLMNWKFKCLWDYCTSKTITNASCKKIKKMPAVFSTEKIKSCVLTIIVPFVRLFLVNNTDLENKNLIFPNAIWMIKGFLCVSIHLKMIVQVLASCKNIVLNLDCSAIQINFAAWAVLIAVNMVSLLWLAIGGSKLLMFWLHLFWSINNDKYEIKACL